MTTDDAKKMQIKKKTATAATASAATRIVLVQPEMEKRQFSVSGLSAPSGRGFSRNRLYRPMSACQ
jgi:hypothetical protein